MTNVLLLSDNELFKADLKDQISFNLPGFEVYFREEPHLNFDIIIEDNEEIDQNINIPVYGLKKPFKLAHFLDELKSCIHRFENSEEGYLLFNDYELRPSLREIVNTKTGEAVKLTEKEVAVIKYLFKAQDRIVSKGELLQEVWGYNKEASTHTIETHIYRLRQKVEHDEENRQLILTEDGGYKLKF